MPRRLLTGFAIRLKHKSADDLKAARPCDYSDISFVKIVFTASGITSKMVFAVGTINAAGCWWLTDPHMTTMDAGVFFQYRPVELIVAFCDFKAKELDGSAQLIIAQWRQFG